MGGDEGHLHPVGNERGDPATKMGAILRTRSTAARPLGCRPGKARSCGSFERRTASSSRPSKSSRRQQVSSRGRATRDSGTTALICRVHRRAPRSFRVAPICRTLSEHGCAIAPRTYYACASAANFAARPNRRSRRSGVCSVRRVTSRRPHPVANSRIFATTCLILARGTVGIQYRAHRVRSWPATTSLTMAMDAPNTAAHARGAVHGATKMWAHLQREGIEVARCTVTASRGEPDAGQRLVGVTRTKRARPAPRSPIRTRCARRTWWTASSRYPPQHAGRGRFHLRQAGLRELCLHRVRHRCLRRADRWLGMLGQQACRVRRTRDPPRRRKPVSPGKPVDGQHYSPQRCGQSIHCGEVRRGPC